jgi:hypothetical protein
VIARVDEALALIVNDDDTVDPEAGEDTLTDVAEAAASSQGMNNRARERRRFFLRRVVMRDNLRCEKQCS